MERQLLLFNEDTVSQLPALHLLQNMGYIYLTPAEALNLRGNRMNEVILESILVQWLRDNNVIRYKERTAPFSEGNIISAVQAIKEVSFDGLVRTNEKIFDLLCLGKSLQQSINGDIKSFTLKYIDWEHPENNVYHVTEEFEVERPGSHRTRRPDIVLFVNGIPLVVIECKSPDRKNPMSEAVSQQIRNQKKDEIPKLFLYSQMLLAVSMNEAVYATTATPVKFWSVWREKYRDDFENEIYEKCNFPLSDDILNKVFSHRKHEERLRCGSYLNVPRKVTVQDRLIYALLRPERLLELIYSFILYDSGEKKIARYQQYFCVHKILERILKINDGGKRTGGVVWHTQGSGKSLTMVYLAKSIALCKDIPDHKIVLVTDRIDLDDQIYGTFHNCGKEVEQSKTGRDLSIKLRENRERIITTVIDKFEAAVGKYQVRNKDPNIFVLVDEGHRSQYGPRHAKMRKVLPNACYIGFTGTPVMKKDRNTVERFGGLIDSYTIDQAVEDKAVVPLLYEGRHVGQKVDSKSIDSRFKRITETLTKEQAADLKKKFSTTDQLNKTEQKVMRVAWDISTYYQDNWQGTGLKSQLVTQDKAAALLYKKYLDEFGIVTSEVLISGPDEREGETDIYKENKLEVQRFWKIMMERYGNEREYNKQIINAFKNGEHPEIIIVVDKLLTGFDAPRNTVLYLTRMLKDHLLLQAIARVNRLYRGKEYGLILDYRGVLENLSEAINIYTDLEEFDFKDIEGILTDVKVPIDSLPEKHSILWDTFKEVKNKSDVEEYELILKDEELRTKFYERLSAYSRVLAIALSSVNFFEETSEEKINRYRNDLKFFSKLRISVRRRYAEVVDFGEYEQKIQKLLDTYIGTKEVERITDLVNIFDKDAFAKEVEKVIDAGAKADTIAHRTEKTIHERMQEDPAFYRKFSELLKDVIRAFHEKRLKDTEYLRKVSEIMNSVLNRTGDQLPKMLEKYDVAKAYYGVIKETMNHFEKSLPGFENNIAEISIEIDKIINDNLIVNWETNIDVQNKIRMEIEDYLFDKKSELGLDISFDEIDYIMEECINIAKVRRQK